MRSWSKNIPRSRPIETDASVLGAVIARALGAWIDRATNFVMGGITERATRAASRQSYSVATIVLAAKLAKADGPVIRAEIDAFKSVFKIPVDEIGDVARIWNAAQRDARGFEAYAHRLAILFEGDRTFLENLMTALIHVALADGAMTPEEVRFLERVEQAFALEKSSFARLRNKIEIPVQDDPYTVLGISPHASDEDVKRAWRRLVRVYHPDAVMASGRSGDFLELAQKKITAVNAAYEEIERSRVRAA